jgi:hypothetical protein
MHRELKEKRERMTQLRGLTSSVTDASGDKEKKRGRRNGR